MLKFKPVYDEPDDSYSLNSNFPRSTSCPSLQLYRSNTLIEFERKHALSDYHVHSYDNPSMLSRHSESDLCRINKTKTFQEKNELPFDTGDVLARVVRALGNITVDGDDNNDNDIMLDTDTITSVMSSESNEYSIPPEKPRLRAVSAYRKPSLIPPIESPHKWTWNGTNAQIQEFRNLRHKSNVKENEIVPTKNLSCSVRVEETCVVNKTHHKFNPTNKNDQKLNVGHHQKRYSIIGCQENMLLKRRPSRIGHLKPHQLNSTSRRPSILEIQENQTDKNLLETSTIADLIRVLETAHTLSNSSNDPVLQELLGVSPLMQSKRLNNRRASMYPRYSEQLPMLHQHMPLSNGNFMTHHNDQLRLSKPDLHNTHSTSSRRFSVHPNPPSTIPASIKQRRQSMRPSHWLNNNLNDGTTEITGRFTVSKRLRPTNSFRVQNNFLRCNVVQSSRNSLSELNEKGDDKIV